MTRLDSQRKDAGGANANTRCFRAAQTAIARYMPLQCSRFRMAILSVRAVTKSRWTVSEPQVFVIPWGGKPKARPRVTTNGTYMPKPYRDWKQTITEYLQVSRISRMEGPVCLAVTFTPTQMIVAIEPSQVARYGNADLDNLVGGLMDVLQDAGVIGNDRSVVAIHASFGA